MYQKQGILLTLQAHLATQRDRDRYSKQLLSMWRGCLPISGYRHASLLPHAPLYGNLLLWDTVTLQITENRMFSWLKNRTWFEWFLFSLYACFYLNDLFSIVLMGRDCMQVFACDWGQDGHMGVISSKGVQLLDFFTAWNVTYFWCPTSVTTRMLSHLCYVRIDSAF